MSTAIERIKGFACEVNEGQWRDLVKVAKSLSVSIDDHYIDFTEINPRRVAQLSESRTTTIGFYSCVIRGKILIPYPDFLAKLKGDEKWQPKNGEEVEVSTCGGVVTGRYMGLFGGNHWVFYDDAPYPYSEVRPLRPTITRKEAEEKLKELGVNARIID